MKNDKAENKEKALMQCFCTRPDGDCALCSVYQAKMNLGKEHWLPAARVGDPAEEHF